MTWFSFKIVTCKWPKIQLKCNASYNNLKYQWTVHSHHSSYNMIGGWELLGMLNQQLNHSGQRTHLMVLWLNTAESNFGRSGTKSLSYGHSCFSFSARSFCNLHEMNCQLTISKWLLEKLTAGHLVCIIIIRFCQLRDKTKPRVSQDLITQKIHCNLSLEGNWKFARIKSIMSILKRTKPITLMSVMYVA